VPLADRETTDLRALHIAQVIQLARDHGATGPQGSFPERAAAPKPRRRMSRRGVVAAVVAGVSLAARAAYANRQSRTRCSARNRAWRPPPEEGLPALLRAGRHRKSLTLSTGFC
jgi:hypothetical protein